MIIKVTDGVLRTRVVISGYKLKPSGEPGPVWVNTAYGDRIYWAHNTLGFDTEHLPAWAWDAGTRSGSVEAPRASAAAMNSYFCSG